MTDTIKLNQCPTCGAAIPSEAPQGLCPKCVLVGAATAVEQDVAAASTSEVPSLTRVAAAFPQLEIHELIGHGGMGFVYKARQPHLDRLVALKVLPDRLARDARFTERFNREGKVLARLAHPNIVAIYDFGKTEEFFYLLMEFVDGVNLRQAMAAGRFSPTEALSIVPMICEALQYAHSQGILHRDIKPANILLDASGKVKIADFGIAKLVGEEKKEVTLTATGAALGTPQYMAPEQLENPTEVDHRADIYSLGVVFYEMLTGELPIGRFAAPSAKTPVNQSVDEVVFRTLEKDRERRYQSAGEMKTRVEDLGKGPFDSVPDAQSGKSKLSQWAIYGVLSIGLSLPVPVSLLLALWSGRGGIGPGELWLGLGSIALPGIGGTLLGWLGLNEIREGQGRIRGLPLALFATLAWPLAILVGLVTALPMFILVPVSHTSLASQIGRFLVMLLPAGAITFAFWSIYATAQWASARTTSPRNRILKWVFASLLIVAFGTKMAFKPAGKLPEHAAIRAGRTQMPPIQANFRAAKGQVVLLQLLQKENEKLVPLPSLEGYVLCPDEERGRFSVMLKPAPFAPSSTDQQSWGLTIATDDGATVMSPLHQFGALTSILASNHLQNIEPDSSFDLILARPSTTASNQASSGAEIALRVISKSRTTKSDPIEVSVAGAGSTNWASQFAHNRRANRGPRPRPGEVLAHQWLKSPASTNTTNSIRFTLTNVELRKEGAVQWMGMDYATDVRGDCEVVFYVDGPGVETRKTGLLVTPPDAPAVLRQRFEWRIPAGANQKVVEELRSEFEKALVGKSFLVPEGEQRPLVRFPIGINTNVSVAIGAMLKKASI